MDRARMARDFDVFMKRIRRIFPGFEYVRLRGTEAWCMACPSGRAACPESLLAQGGAGEVIRPSEGCLAGCGGSG